ncbi:DNA-directed RNA polymerase sigma-70 factor [Microbispora rosea subsp. aerata]|nr:RNA polymerase sigma-70 factor [Microbispora rosea]GGO03991.1 DNA-directed RNA polymerase sigma-70 factor [Microbispora rosea subsp. aerata]GIH54918.1 DNA-directed RNA polymerase sigma-70 factor [Microbispora rosea subsp. aerata]GLJ82932.1 DNA-directed RNA polymerase sigma-70 factor [Microbispora rosea subsp. aerata]
MTDDPGEEFGAHRARLFGLAYRLLGSATEAEDAVQDTYLRWNAADRAAIAAPGAWLAKVLTNICLNRLTSARSLREEYPGPWLPEPVLTDEPLETAEQRDSISMAFLVLLERLTPAERAVFVLREAFAYGYRDIADVLGLSEANCRQLHRRARLRVGERRRFDAPAQARRRIVERFLRAAENGDLAGLESVLAADVVAWSDGGGRASSALRPVMGAAKVSRYLAGLVARAARMGARLGFAEVNGEPAVLAFLGGGLVSVLVVESDGERVHGLRFVVNPDKLAYLAGQLSHREDVAGS